MWAREECRWRGEECTESVTEGDVWSQDQDLGQGGAAASHGNTIYTNIYYSHKSNSTCCIPIKKKISPTLSLQQYTPHLLYYHNNILQTSVCPQQKPLCPCAVLPGRTSPLWWFIGRHQRLVSGQYTPGQLPGTAGGEGRHAPSLPQERIYI